MTETRPKTILLFGGSFNPIHLAHVAMVDWALSQCPDARVIVVPCWTHPFGKPLAPFADRVAMCRLAWSACPAVEVSTIEATLGGVSYTARTLRALQSAHPDVAWRLLVGADASAELPTWQDAAWLQHHAPLLVAPRGPHSPVPDISSSEIRDRLRRKESAQMLLPTAVATYIQIHGVYDDGAEEAC